MIDTAEVVFYAAGETQTYSRHDAAQQFVILGSRNISVYSEVAAGAPHISLDAISNQGVMKVRAKTRRVLRPYWRDDDKLYYVERDGCGLFAFAATIDELKSEVEEQLLMLWREFACENVANLSPQARKVKKGLLADWEAV